MSKELDKLLQEITIIPIDLLRLYPNDGSLHDIANELADKINAIKVELAKLENGK